MSFVKRSDGITYYNGAHCGVRDLSQVSCVNGVTFSEFEDFREEDEALSEEDDWMNQVITASMSLEDSVLSGGYSDEVLNIWETYNHDCPFVKRKEFDDEYFWPDY